MRLLKNYGGMMHVEWLELTNIPYENALMTLFLSLCKIMNIGNICHNLAGNFRRTGKISKNQIWIADWPIQPVAI